MNSPKTVASELPAHQALDSTRYPRTLRWSWYLHLTTGWALAVAQPILDLLGKNAVFFVSHRASSLEVILFAVGLTFLPPLALFLVEVALSLMSPRLAEWSHAVMVSILVASFTIVIFKSLLYIGPLTWTALAITSITATTVLINRSSIFRQFLTYLSPAAVLFVLAFLLLSPASQLVTGPTSSASPITASKERTPVILIVLDELPVASIMTSEGEVDSNRLPNFARLQREATWYRNASAVHPGTRHSVPSILSGVRNAADTPTASHFPQNLFAMVRDSHTIDAYEEVTQLCTGECGGALGQHSTEGTRARYAALLDDVAIVYGNIALPESWLAGFPPIDQSWSHFRTGANFGGTSGTRRPGAVDRTPNMSDHDFRADARQAVRRDQARRVDAFTDGLKSVQQPGFHYLHLTLPHGPYRYMPSGKLYDWRPNVGMSGQEKGAWGQNEYLIRQMQQRHLLQLSYADTLLGDILDELEDNGLFDPAMLVVTADHGVSFQAGVQRRLLTRRNAASVLGVPLFIKYPGSTGRGRIDDGNVELVDIAPTIADVLNVGREWEFDGESLLAADRSRRINKRARLHREEVELPADLLPEVMEVVEHRISRFGRPSHPYDLFDSGPYGHLIGRAVKDVGGVTSSGMSAAWESPRSFEALDEDTEPWPNHVSGAIQVGSSSSPTLSLALALDGEIVAVGETYDYDQGIARFALLASDRVFTPGQNSVRLFIVRGPPGQRALAEIDVP